MYNLIENIIFGISLSPMNMILRDSPQMRPLTNLKISNPFLITWDRK